MFNAIESWRIFICSALHVARGALSRAKAIVSFDVLTGHRTIGRTWNLRGGYARGPRGGGTLWAQDTPKVLAPVAIPKQREAPCESGKVRGARDGGRERVEGGSEMALGCNGCETEYADGRKLRLRTNPSAKNKGARKRDPAAREGSQEKKPSMVYLPRGVRGGPVRARV